MSEISDMLPERVRNVNLYDPLREPITYDLSDNTSQWGMAPGVREEIASLASDPSVHLSRYPEIYGASLKRALSQRYEEFLSDTPTENIVIGCGTDDVLDCIVRACTQAGDTIISPTPSFPMAGYFGRYNDRKIVDVALEIDGSIDVDKFLETPSKLIYLCSPNNPTGLAIARDGIDELVRRYDGFIVIDEAYAVFAKSNCLDLLRSCSRVIITRTFSKMHALAGLRLGYGLGNKEIISAVEALRGPYKANTIALSAALFSMGQKTWIASVLEQTHEQREWFMRELFALGFAPLPSDANFVFTPMEISDELRDAFKRAEIAVRIFDDVAIYGPGVRVTIAPREILQKVVDILKGFAP